MEETKLTKKTDEDKYNDIDRAKPKITITTLMYRKIRLNLDILQIICICITFMFVGYCMAYIFFGLTGSQVKTSIGDFFDTLLAIITGVSLIIWRLYTPAGSISSELIKSGNKSSQDLDNNGMTIVRN